MYHTQTKRDLPNQSLDLLKDLQRYMQDFKSRSTIDHAVRRFTSIIERPHKGLPKLGSFMRIYVFNMLAQLKKQGDPVQIYTCLYKAKNRTDYFSEKQRESLGISLSEAEHFYGSWLRNTSLNHSPPHSSSSSSSSVPPPPSPSPNHRSPSPPPPSPPPRPSAMPMITSTLISSSAPLSPSHFPSQSLPSYNYAAKSEEEIQRETPTKRKGKEEADCETTSRRNEEEDRETPRRREETERGTSRRREEEEPRKRRLENIDNGPSKAIKQENSLSEYSIAGTVLSQAAESLKQAKAIAQSAKDISSECGTKIQSLAARVDDDDKRMKREIEHIKTRQSTAQNLLEHIEANFYELEKSVKHLEDKYRENAKLNTDRLRDLELQMKQLTDYIKKGDFATSSNSGAAISNSNDDKFPALQPNNMTSIVVKKEQDNPSSDGFFAFV